MTGPDSRDILLRMVANFPGLVIDDGFGGPEVSGADLVEWVVNELHERNDAELRKRAKHGTPSDRALLAQKKRTAKLIQAARELHADKSNDEVEIDDDALTSRGDGGTWVQSWVWVADSEIAS